VTYYLKMVALTVIETIGIAVVLFLLLIGQWHLGAYLD
jgi:hypothetical protein